MNAEALKQHGVGIGVLQHELVETERILELKLTQQAARRWPLSLIPTRGTAEARAAAQLAERRARDVAIAVANRTPAR